jgi:hypothetical protein
LGNAHSVFHADCPILFFHQFLLILANTCLLVFADSPLAGDISLWLWLHFPGD